MQIDLGEIAKQVGNWYKDSSFIEMRTKKQLCSILDKAILKATEFNFIFKNVAEFFELEDVIDIMKHAHVNISDDLSDAQTILHRVARVLDLNILNDVKECISSCSYSVSCNDKKNDSESIKALISAGKEDSLENLNRIYKILSFAAQEGYNSTIEYAIQNNYIDVKGKICQKNILNRYNFIDSNILIKAAYEGDLTLVQSLYKNNANMKYKTKEQESILHAFSASGNLEGVKFALNFFDINSVNSGNETALYVALFYLRYNVVEYILQRSYANLNIKADMGSNTGVILDKIRESGLILDEILNKKSNVSDEVRSESKKLIESAVAALENIIE